MGHAVTALSVFVFGLGAACADDGADDPCPAATAISVEDFAFSPTCIRVAKGAEVTFTNRSTHAHTIASDADQADPFDSGTVAAQAEFKRTFAVAGTIAFHCGFHPQQMKATIVVE